MRENKAEVAAVSGAQLAANSRKVKSKGPACNYKHFETTTDAPRYHCNNISRPIQLSERLISRRKEG
jgi:hypothetical protein